MDAGIRTILVGYDARPQPAPAPIDAKSAPRWFALPLLTLGTVGFAAAWLLLSLSVGGQCAWLAPVAALDMILLLRLSSWPAGASRAAWAVLATAAAIALANFCIAAAQLGMTLGLRPWDSATRLGPSYAWLLSRLATSPLDMVLYAAGLLLAAWAGLSGRRPAPSVH